MNHITRYTSLIALWTLPLFVGAQDAEPVREGATLTNPLKNDIDNFPALFKAILEEVILPLSIVIGVMFIIWSGLRFVMAQGNPTKLAEARKQLMYVLIGVAIVIGAEVILNLLLSTVNEITNI